MPTWPSSLPTFFPAATDSRQDGTIRTPMDVGPAKARRRYSAVSRFVSAPVALSAAQRTTLDTFYATTLSEGALTFDIADPFGGATVEARFTAPPAYSFSGKSGAAARWFNAVLSLEILP